MCIVELTGETAPQPRPLRRLPLATATLLLALLSACATPTGSPAQGSANARTGESTADLPAVPLSSSLLYEIMAADIAAQRGQPAIAYATYMSLALRTSDPRLARRALEVALREQDTASALDASRLWSRLAPRDRQATQSLTLLLVSRGLMDEARPRLQARLEADKAIWEKANRRGGQLPEESPWEQAQRALMRAPNKFEAYQVLADLFSADMKEPAALRVLAAQAHFAGASQMAVEHARQLAQVDPSAGNTLLLAQYQQTLPDGNKASIQTLENFLKAYPGHLEISGALARLYTVEQQWDKARQLFEPLLAREPGNTELLYILTGLAIQQNDRSAADRHFREYLKRTGDSDDRDITAVLLSLTQMAEDAKDYSDALGWLDKVRNPAALPTARLRKAQILAKQGQTDAAIELLKTEKADSDNDRLQVILTQAQILREADRLKAAATVLSDALKEMPDQPDLLYEDAMLAEKQQQMDRVERNLRKVIALRPDNPHAYNALGYSFADRNIRLEEAQTLIQRATELAPNDAYIMDSLGWVQFRQGNAAEALKTLQKAYSIKQDPEIAIHLGEVLWTLGRKDEALQMLRSVKDNNGTAQIFKDAVSRLGISGI